MSEGPKETSIVDTISVDSTRDSLPVCVEISPVDLQLNRDDLLAALAAYRARSMGRQQWRLLLLAFTALAAGPVLMTVRGMIGLPEVLDWYLLGAAWVGCMAFGVTLFRRERKFRERIALNCPECGVSFFDNGMRNGQTSRVEAALTHGVCESCGARVF